MYYIYIIKCNDNSLYTGITTDIKRRYQEHIDGKGAKYTRMHKPLSVEALWTCEDKSQASKLEYWIKTLSKEEKEKIIINDEYLQVYLGKHLELDKYIRIIQENIFC